MKTGRKIIIVFSVLFMTALFLTGCVSPRDAGRFAAEIVKERQRNENSGTIRAKSDKHDIYESLYDNLNGNFLDVLIDYEYIYGWEDQIDIQMAGAIMPVFDSERKIYQDALVYAAEKPVISGADDVVQEMVPVLLEMHDLLDEMYNYYEQEEYKTDGFAQGQMYHGQVIRLYSQISPMMDQFFYYFGIESGYEEDYSAGELLADNRYIQYHAEEIIKRGQELSLYLTENEYDNTNIHTADLKEFKGYYNALMPHIEGFLDESEDYEQYAYESSFTGHYDFYYLYEDVYYLYVSLDEMYQAVKEEKKLGGVTYGAPETFDALGGEIYGIYNDIISG